MPEPGWQVLYIWDPNIIRYFLDHVADFIAGSPFAVAFREKIRTALRPWRECRQKYPNLALQDQADRALRHFCFDGDLKWVSLLMWAGADPRSSGPMFDYDEDDADGYTTALDAATYCDNVQILKQLKPDAKRDDINTLLRNAAGGGRASLVEYLSELGGNPMTSPTVDHRRSTTASEASDMKPQLTFTKQITEEGPRRRNIPLRFLCV